MTEFKSWLVENWATIFKEREEYQNFLVELDVNGVAVGIKGLYQLDYSFAGQVVGLVVTLFTITLQSERPVNWN